MQGTGQRAVFPWNLGEPLPVGGRCGPGPQLLWRSRGSSMERGRDPGLQLPLVCQDPRWGLPAH